MVQTVEMKPVVTEGINHSIPVPTTPTILETDSGKWEQILKIPVERKPAEAGNTRLTYAFRFPELPEYKSSPLNILAGGDLLMAEERMIVQMLRRLESALVALEKPEPPLNAALQVNQISPYFRKIP